MKEYDADRGHHVNIRCNKAGKSPRSLMPSCAELDDCPYDPACAKLGECRHKIFKYADGSDQLSELLQKEKNFYEQVADRRDRQAKQTLDEKIAKIAAELTATADPHRLPPSEVIQPSLSSLQTSVAVPIPTYLSTALSDSETPIIAATGAAYDPNPYNAKTFDCTFLLRKNAHYVHNLHEYKIANTSLATGRLYLQFGEKIPRHIRHIKGTWKRDSKIFLRLHIKLAKDYLKGITSTSTEDEFTRHTANVQISGYVRQQVLEKRYPSVNLPGVPYRWEVCKPIILEYKSFTVGTQKNLPNWQIEVAPGINLGWALEKNILSKYSLLWKNLRKLNLIR